MLWKRRSLKIVCPAISVILRKIAQIVKNIQGISETGKGASSLTQKYESQEEKQILLRQVNR